MAGIEALSGDALSLVGLGASPAPAASLSNVDAGPDAGEPIDAAAPATGEATEPASVADPGRQAVSEHHKDSRRLLGRGYSWQPRQVRSQLDHIGKGQPTEG